MSSAYRLTGSLEAGELAELYEATQEPGGLPVVIKLFHPKTSDPRYASTLAATSSVLNPLRSEGIIHVLDVGFVKNRLAVVREAADGPNLGFALQRLNAKEILLQPPVALGLVLQLLDAVERAHAAGVVHGAITPGNVLLSRSGAPRMSDFGALHALLAVPELKRAFVGRGRSAYRAPEVGRGEPPDVFSDVYSLGAIAYELLTLREAVVPEGGVSTRRAGLPPPSRLDRRIHARLDPLVLRALEATPSRRYRSCIEFAAALRGFLSNQGGMPGADEQRRFVAEVLAAPGQSPSGAGGPLPFTERFSLTPISGVSLAQVRADTPEHSLVARAPFSPALSDADTMDAPPAFEEYRGEAPSPVNSGPSFEPETVVPLVLPPSLVSSSHRTGSADTYVRGPVPEALPGEAEPRAEAALADEEPGRAASGDDEPTWVAPPGAAPVKSRRMAGPSGPREGSRVGRNPRLRVVEDFSRPPEPVPADPDDLVDTTRIAMGARPRPPLPLARGPVEPDEPPEPAPAPPMPTAPELPAVIAERQRLYTEERNLLEDTWSRRRMMAVAGAVALVGLACFVLGVWKFSRPPPVDTDPKVDAVSGAVQQYLQEAPPAAESAEAVPGEATPGEAAPAPALPPVSPPAPSTEPPLDITAKGNLAWISFQANRPARAIIDGVRVKRPLPLVRYPLKPGEHEIILETVRVPHQREKFQVRLGRGEHRKIEQFFASHR